MLYNYITQNRHNINIEGDSVESKKEKKGGKDIRKVE